MGQEFTYKGERLNTDDLPRWEEELQNVRAEIGTLHKVYLKVGASEEIEADVDRLADAEGRLCNIINIAREQQRAERLAAWADAVADAKQRKIIPE